MRCAYIRTDERAGEICNARLLDARIQYERTSVRKATLIIRCWRCHRVVPLRPTPDDEDETPI